MSRTEMVSSLVWSCFMATTANAVTTKSSPFDRLCFSDTLVQNMEDSRGALLVLHSIRLIDSDSCGQNMAIII
jgi:hypothetical protein